MSISGSINKIIIKVSQYTIVAMYDVGRANIAVVGVGGHN